MAIFLLCLSGGKTLKVITGIVLNLLEKSGQVLLLGFKVICLFDKNWILLY